MFKKLAVQHHATSPAVSTISSIPGVLRSASLPGCPLCSDPGQRTLLEDNGKLLMKCPHCGVSYVWPQPSPADVAAHFEIDITADQRDLERKFERNRKKVLACIADHIQHRRAGGAILDVGCATGFFLGRFFQKPEWQTWALELSPLAAGKAAEKGIRVHRGDIHNAGFAQAFFDVITVLDAFCYFLKPERELAEFCRVLKDDGLLVLELPLATSRIWRTSRPIGKLLSSTRQPLLQSSDHLFYFTPRSISLVLERCGFQVQTIVALPGNRQERLLRNLAYHAYFILSSLMHFVSGSRIFLGPRFVVVASKAANGTADCVENHHRPAGRMRAIRQTA